ncbi:MAG: ornithine carbamoyltransferase [Candidatus Thermoplasmatota archaeon]|nr:ornithine carbamoyltransferase [Candidatus Thermoplasmatota archaeon]MBU1941916.1 ornithine carbamoyltransferase [Candidatus Thermoplasmatota archaeon]
MKKNVLSILDIHKEIQSIIDSGMQLKQQYAQNRLKPVLMDKTLAMIFERPSTRTRVSFEVGMGLLGGHSIFLTKNDIQLGSRESAEDIALVLSRYADIIMYRAVETQHLIELAMHATVPVINGLDSREHPCQILADFMTIKEHKKDFNNLHFVFIGDGDDNLTHSYLLGCPLVGMHITVISPKHYWPAKEYIEKARKLANQKQLSVKITDDLSALTSADIVATDTWISYWYEQTRQQRIADFASYRITPKIMQQAKPDALFMHCMPIYYSEEVEKSVAHGPKSIILDEAENRMWVQMALMKHLLLEP